MPTPVSILARASSITNSFINAIIPVVVPSQVDIEEALRILAMDPTDVRCAYCGDRSTEWDHLRPLVVDQRPTGYISEIANLVPACGKCNQSKGNKPWRQWMTSPAPQSPKTRGIVDIELRINRLTEYEQWRDIQPLDFEAIIGAEVWQQHWANWQRIIDEIRTSQQLATQIRATIRIHHRDNVPSESHT